MSDESTRPEVIAERTEGAAVASGFGVDARSIIDTWGNILEAASVQPRAVLEAGRDFAEISAGSGWAAANIPGCIGYTIQ